MEIFRHNLNNCDNISMRCAKSPQFDTATKVLFILGGRSEWVEKFQSLIESLNLSDEIGWMSWDHRGQGDSGGKRGHINDYTDFALDAQELIDAYAKNRPYSLVCHSMGSLIALIAAMKGFIKPRSLFLLSPLFGLPQKPIPQTVGRPLARVAMLAGLGEINLGFDKHANIPFERNRLTHSPTNYEKILDYPFEWSGPTFTWIDATFRATDFIFLDESLKQLKAKTYVLGGTDERVVDPSKFKSWVDKAKEFASVELKIIQGARHELHMEEKVYFDEAVKFIHENLEF